MHVEVPKKGGLASMKAFVGEYTMIVISILTALALEHGVQTWHRNHIAHDAAVKIDEEITGNLNQFKEAGIKNAKILEHLHAVREIMRADLKSGASREVVYQHLKQAFPDGFSESFGMPMLQRNAWEVAVASQAASWMEHDKMARYAAIYSLIRGNSNDFTVMGTMVNGPAFANAFADMGVDKGDPLDVYHSIVQMQTSLNMVQSSITQAERIVKEFRPQT